MIPNVAVIRIESPRGTTIPLWIPLILLWIPLLLLSPLILLVIIGACLAGRANPWRAIAAFWAILCSLPGTHVHVSANGAKVLVRIR
jgi:hypothetical protein